MNQTLTITPENIETFPIGTKILQRSGAYYPEIEGVVIGHEYVAASKFFPAMARLRALMNTFDDYGNIVQSETVVSQVYLEGANIGPIGTYVLERGLMQNQTPKYSPWAK
jgi:hypothetical protein